ncbi:hypothetical protein HN789_04920 [archaeon]|mgnify:CR=1 FL=1|jgi:hypothetical protein|nr:hypothetical protein [archaeon]MBT4022387.1 hypothetical protein [archaeon]MBT4273265.1 hypothetical protein [archaeon]MBT4461292.1 hypothetical protein [archaeon]MBT4858589.1 hypothetical protein [archaeon]
MSEFVIFMHVIISIISVVLFVMLSLRFFKESKALITTRLTKVLLFLLFFLFLDGFFNTMTYFVGTFTMFYSTEIIQIISKVGVFGSIVFLAHFAYDKKFEELKDKEHSVLELKEINKQLEIKTLEMERSQAMQERKLKELERFNTIAKEREAKMMKLLKKADKIERKLK